jgi:hypothetical protein
MALIIAAVFDVDEVEEFVADECLKSSQGVSVLSDCPLGKSLLNVFKEDLNELVESDLNLFLSQS